MTTTFRADVVAGLTSVLQAFQTANPTLLRAVFPARPSRYTGDMPFAYIETRNESVTHDSGTRTRTMTPSVVVVDQLTDNEETMARFDALVDLLMDHFTANPQLTPVTIWSALTVTDDYEEVGDRVFAAARFAFQNVSIQEGRN